MCVDTPSAPKRRKCRRPSPETIMRMLAEIDVDLDDTARGEILAGLWKQKYLRARRKVRQLRAKLALHELALARAGDSPHR